MSMGPCSESVPQIVNVEILQQVITVLRLDPSTGSLEG